MTGLTKEELENKVHELEHEIRALHKDLMHDALTGLKTRNYFDHEAKKLYQTCTGASQGSRREWFGFRNMSFVFLDLDLFKNVNDRYGHFAGDEVLKVVANAIKQGVRKSDIVARWGGEEFIVALVGAREKAAHKKAESIRQSIENLKFEDMPELVVTASAGVSSSERNLTYEDAIARADKAMYAAKENGRNRVVLYSELNK